MAHCSEDVALASKLLRGFGDRTRLSIIVELSRGEQRVSELIDVVGGSQGNVSGHLKCLKECGLVVDRPVGREVYYSIAHPEVLDVVRSVEALLDVTGQSVELCPRYAERAVR